MKKRLVLGGGCFWCIEAVYSSVKGVSNAESAYTGGNRPNPSYESVCTGVSGHAEVVVIEYDERIISMAELLEIFFAIHDPTTRNAQGADKGTQYRSVIYYEDEVERSVIIDSIAKHQESFNEKIVTEVSKIEEVYLAESYHQNYFKNHAQEPYCQAVIAPKLQKFRMKFPQKLV